ncbi:NUDIX domain-containing protein [Actinomadura nitritigenes]|uniref:NUDIX domain-containing protein n=1 Tax=Actinomadura nitritigenes TaxID=134602 RepID=A0ABS3RE60_9ACTN|nr:NUDIX domain-containing protein [Actinomadura nitritigenes]
MLLTRCPDTGQRAVPGGTVEPGETSPGSMVRELLEETGAQPRPRRPGGPGAPASRRLGGPGPGTGRRPRRRAATGAPAAAGPGAGPPRQRGGRAPGAVDAHSGAVDARAVGLAVASCTLPWPGFVQAEPLGKSPSP